MNVEQQTAALIAERAAIVRRVISLDGVVAAALMARKGPEIIEQLRDLPEEICALPQSAPGSAIFSTICRKKCPFYLGFFIFSNPRQDARPCEWFGLFCVGFQRFGLFSGDWTRQGCDRALARHLLPRARLVEAARALRATKWAPLPNRPAAPAGGFNRLA